MANKSELQPTEEDSYLLLWSVTPPTTFNYGLKPTAKSPSMSSRRNQDKENTPQANDNNGPKRLSKFRSRIPIRIPTRAEREKQRALKEKRPISSDNKMISKETVKINGPAVTSKAAVTSKVRSVSSSEETAARGTLIPRIAGKRRCASTSSDLAKDDSRPKTQTQAKKVSKKIPEPLLLQWKKATWK